MLVAKLNLKLTKMCAKSSKIVIMKIKMINFLFSGDCNEWKVVTSNTLKMTTYVTSKVFKHN